MHDWTIGSLNQNAEPERVEGREAGMLIAGTPEHRLPALDSGEMIILVRSSNAIRMNHPSKGPVLIATTSLRPFASFPHRKSKHPDTETGAHPKTQAA